MSGKQATQLSPGQRALRLGLFLLTAYRLPLTAQLPADLGRERTAFADWLATAPNSPLAAIVQQPLGPALSLGPAGSDVPLPGLEASRIVEEHGVASLLRAGQRSSLPRFRLFPLGPFTGFLSGSPGRSILSVYRKDRQAQVPQYFRYDSTLNLTLALAPPHQSAAHRILALDGVEVEATEAGTVLVSLGGRDTRLRVYRLPDPTSEEFELAIYFRDGSNGQGSYPAGRFVSLLPLPDGRYRLDFNRARNPFCAYSSVYPCPAPWPGNSIPVPVPAGERYESKN